MATTLQRNPQHRPQFRFGAACLLLASNLTVTHAALPPSAAGSIVVLRSIGSEGKGNAEATSAWTSLATRDAGAIPSILESMDGSNELAMNWLRMAVDSIAEREIRGGKSLPVAELDRFLANPRHQPRARRLAYELIARVDTAQAERLLPGFLNDPSGELRRDAVQQVMATAAKSHSGGDKSAAIAEYRKALQHARDVDQIEGIAQHLKEMGETVSLPEVFGWVTRWQVIGPFDSTGGAGFDAAYPPETAINLTREYDGKGKAVRWQGMVVTDEYGKVDFNKPYTPLKGVAGYALAELDSPSAGPAEIRIGSKNAWKVWWNDRFIFGRDEYHRGMEIDQYRLPIELKAGKNTLLVKVCQNEQTDDWASEWEFQLRVTDAQGTPIRLRQKE